MNHHKIHILYESGADPRPYSSSYIRLLRPLTHPSLRQYCEVTWDSEYEGQPVDIVIVDRLWRPDVSIALVRNLLENVDRAGARLIYALDDDLLEVLTKSNNPSKYQLLAVVELFLRQANGLLVTTHALQRRLASFNSKIEIVPNALDERLLIRRELPRTDSPFGSRRKVIGYMGTFTHDDDLLMVLPALRTIWQRYPKEIEFQLVGVTERASTLHALKPLPVRVVSPKLEEVEYPLFMLWFSSHIRWDIAIAPLRDTPFTRCKSDVKFLDYSAIGAPGIYSRVSAYETSVQHLETGWLVENTVEAWLEALEELLFNDSLRMQLAQNAAQYLNTERILARSAHNWLEALERLLDGISVAHI